RARGGWVLGGDQGVRRSGSDSGRVGVGARGGDPGDPPDLERQHGIRFEGNFYPLAGAHSGPVPAHPMGIWLGAYKPRMLSVVGRLADGWVPSLGYFKPADLLEGNRRIDEAATAAGRDPRSIRRLLNSG